MKHLFIFIICCLTISKSFAQLNIGKSVSPINLYVSNHKQEVFDNLKKTTTYFIVPEQMDFNKIENTIKDVWTFSDIKFISENEFDENQKNYQSTQNSFIKLINRAYSKQKGIVTVAEYISFKFMFYSIASIKKKKNNELKIKYLNIAEIFFTPSISFRRGVVASNNRAVWFSKEVENNKENDFYNFNLGYVKNYFQMLNLSLNSSKNLKMRDGLKNKTKIQNLKNNILFAPDWILKKYNPMSIGLKKIMEPTKLFKKYDYEYKVIPNNELNLKILNGEDFYYLMHTQFNHEKIISVIHSLTGEIIFLSQDKSFNIRPSDLNQISNLVK